MFTYPAQAISLEGKQTAVTLTMDCCVAAGYTGRNQDNVKAHIDELQKLGVQTPYATPAFYWISPNRLTSQSNIVVVGEQSSPEVEFFIAYDQSGDLYMTVASDHTDRELEAVSVGKAKQICDKVLGDVFWGVRDIEAHWDQITLDSIVLHHNDWLHYQSGTLADILPLEQLLSLAQNDDCSGDRPCLLSGTIPIKGGETLYTSCCKITMTDPVLKRSITKQYTITTLPDRS